MGVKTIQEEKYYETGFHTECPQEVSEFPSYFCDTVRVITTCFPRTIRRIPRGRSVLCSGIQKQITNDELLSQALCTTPLYEPTIDQHLHSMADILQRIGPRDGIEALLAVQMVSVHHLARASLGDAMKPGQGFEITAAHVNLATKLLRTFTAQTEALDRRRRPSGQAIVGPVNHRVPGKESEDNEKTAG
jgi:hypothetical protein